jgi:YD repeat-containing protein
MCAAAAGDRTIFPKSPSSPPNALEQFTYDTAGNRLTDLTHTNYQYNELNQLIEDDSCMYNYDADGNMTTKISKNTGDTTTFVWDIENKLVEVRKPGMIAKYTYDALGRRMSKDSERRDEEVRV